MPETGDDGVDEAERVAAGADREKEAWASTLDDMTAMADELREEGWDVVAIPAGHTAPESPDAGATDRFGLTYVIPGNYTDEFGEAFEAGGFPQYEVYRAEADGRAYLVTVLLDPDSETAILLAGTYEIRHALPCMKAAAEAGTMFTHVQTLDETHLGSFEHDDHERFFPDRAQVESWAVDPEA
jgi:hypothetical protein